MHIYFLNDEIKCYGWILMRITDFFYKLRRYNLIYAFLGEGFSVPMFSCNYMLNWEHEGHVLLNKDFLFYNPISTRHIPFQQFNLTVEIL